MIEHLRGSCQPKRTDKKIFATRKKAYLGADDLPLCLLVILASQFQSIRVLLLPVAELLAQAFVLHLKPGSGVIFVLVFREAGGDFFPGKPFAFPEGKEEAVVIGDLGC